MANPTVLTKTLAASAANNICLSQTPTSGTALTLNGTTVAGGVATLDTARRVLVTFGNEVLARTIVILGTNETGNPISETLAVPAGAGATVATLQDYLTITAMTPASAGNFAWTAAITVGTNGVGSSAWKIVDSHVTPASIALNVLVSGAINYSVEYTYGGVPGTPANPSNIPWTYPTAPQVLQHPVLTNLATSADGGFTTPFPRAWRLTVNSGTGTAEVTGIQAGIA